MDTRQAIKQAITGLAILTLTWACSPLNQPEATPTPSAPTHPPTEISVSIETTTPDVSTSTAESCTDQTGHVQVGVFDADALPQFHIYLPPCYDENSFRRYPVLYLIHGQGFSDAQWIELGVAQTADALIADEEIPPFIIVMPFDRFSTWLVEDDLFGEVFVDEFIPFIEGRYRTLGKRPFRAIGGLSRGAGWAFRHGLSNWKLFSIVGLHSPAIFHNDAAKANAWLDTIPQAAWPQIYLDVSDQDAETDLALEFGNLLTEIGIPHEWHLFTGLHNEDYWRAHVGDYLRWYGQAFEVRP